MNQLAVKLPEGNAVYEFFGATTGLLGAAILAAHGTNADWGFVFFLMSNVFFIIFSIKAKLSWLFIMQVGFTATSVIGIYNGILSPYL